MKTEVLVSVVIPTRNRPSLVVRAVESVLKQTYPHIEVLVVVDGPDQATVDALDMLGNSLVTVIGLAKNVGGSEARNTGVRASRGEWVAFLDDDDEWLPEKLSSQMAAVDKLQNRNVILSCKYVERSTHESRIYPARLPDHGERLDDYLCCPRGFSTGGEILQTSTFLVPKTLMMSVPFVAGLKRGQDFMWLIRAGGVGKATFHVVPEVLSVFNAEGFTDNSRISTIPHWRSFYACAQDNRSNFSSAAYAYCIATRILTDVIKCKEPVLVKLRLFGECLYRGYASPKCLLIFLYVWLVPQQTRSGLGEALRSISRRAETTNSPMGAS